jgi:uncharacterized membrane protein
MPDLSPSSRTRLHSASELTRVEHLLPFWGPQLVILVAIIIDVTLPDRLSPFGPRWLLPGLELLLLIGLVAASPQPRARHSPGRRRFALGLIALVSAANIVSLMLLVHYLLLPTHVHTSSTNPGHALILAGSGLWMTNVLLFGVWYWELDRGGPVARRLGEADQPDFLFPQMTEPLYAPEGWLPGLVDYLYVSFTNATAFSPTDTMPLSPMAKWLMAAQSLASLVTVGLVVARAVNILG